MQEILNENRTRNMSELRAEAETNEVGFHRYGKTSHFIWGHDLGTRGNVNYEHGET